MGRTIATSFWDNMLLPDIRAASGSEFFVFHQDSDPSHRSKDTVALLDQEMPDFIPPALWPRPPNSPDLNPVDYGLHRLEYASGTSLSYQDLGRWRNEKTHQQRVGRSVSRGYWKCSFVSVFIFPPHLTSASALLGKARKQKSHLFHWNVVLRLFHSSTSRCLISSTLLKLIFTLA